MKKLSEEILTDITKLLKNMCALNMDFADTIIDEISSPLIKSVSFNREKDGIFVVRFVAPYSSLISSLQYNLYDDGKHSCKCKLKISNSGFQYEKISVEGRSNRRLGKVTYKYTLKCEKKSDFINFSKEKFSEYKGKKTACIPYASIESSNEIDIFNSSKQVLREENEVQITCHPSPKGELYVKEELDKTDSIMEVTNPLALELLNRLGYSILSVGCNKSEHIEVWPILENSVVKLIKKEKKDYFIKDYWDPYYNEQDMYVGNNKYESHKKLKPVGMYYDNKKEREIATKYFEGSISIEEVLKAGEKLLIEHEEEAKNFKMR